MYKPGIMAVALQFIRPDPVAAKCELRCDDEEEELVGCQRRVGNPVSPFHLAESGQVGQLSRERRRLWV